MASTVRVDDALHARLRAIAKAEGRPIGQVIEDAIRRYEREAFWRGVREDFDRLRADPAAWREYQEEAAAWDATAGDGLENEEPYYTPEEEEEIRAHYARTYGG
jgi:predicted transcriptional regulator